jgi:hypothetical protein
MLGNGGKVLSVAVVHGGRCPGGRGGRGAPVFMHGRESLLRSQLAGISVDSVTRAGRATWLRLGEEEGLTMLAHCQRRVDTRTRAGR